VVCDSITLFNAVKYSPENITREGILKLVIFSTTLERLSFLKLGRKIVFSIGVEEK